MLARAQELARRWASALILARPLDGIDAVPLVELAREAPSLCAQALRAMQSDVELERLTGRGAPTGREGSAAALRLAAISGAGDPAAVVDAVEALRGVLWEALLDQLNEPSARQVADVSDRLAYVCAAALASAIDATAPPASERSGDAHGAVDAPASEVRIVDERPLASAPAPLTRERSPSWDEPAPIPPGAPAVEIEIRDERGEGGPAAWIGSIGARLARFERDGLPFAVLLVELVDLERLRREQSPEELSRLAGRVEQALTAALGAWSGPLARERPGRCWLLIPETDRAAARQLAERLVAAVASRASHRGTPLQVAIGTAVCPEDGRQAAALAAHADVGLYAARAAARAAGASALSSVDESG
jgi:GGDEF domain-containing protein